MKLAITVGLPLSGKSTLCKEMENTRKYTVVCPDEIRLALHGEQFIPRAEPHVWAVAQTMVRALLMRDYQVVVDATHSTKARRKMWVDIAKEFKTDLQILYVTTPLEKCLQRNDELGRLPSDIINRMASNWEDPEYDEGNLVKGFEELNKLLFQAYRGR